MYQYNKLWISLVMAIAAFLRSYSSIDLGVDDATATAIVGAIWSALVWLVPNTPKKVTVDDVIDTPATPRPITAGGTGAGRDDQDG